ncbi:MAG: AAA family ATPase [Ignavibacteriales bacterium]|nr:AAA family ATPase [Ignavibacteriales bacterium]
MFDEELNTLQAEAYDHLWNGRFRLALNAAEKVYQSRPDDSEAAICYAWALLENGNPIKAMDYANLSVELKGDSIKARVYRSYLLYRMSIFEGAIADTDQSIDKQKEILAWTYLNRSKSYAGLQKFEDANAALELALIIDNGKNPSWKEMRDWLDQANQIRTGKMLINSKNINTILESAGQAIKAKEFWFSLYCARKILEKNKNDEAELMELESMLHLFQLKPALKKADSLANKYKKNERFTSIHNALKKFSQLEQESDVKTEPQKRISHERMIRERSQSTTSFAENDYKTESYHYPNDFVDIYSLKLFDAVEESKSGSRIYCKSFANSTRIIAAEIIFNNLYYKKEDKIFSCSLVWYHNDFEIGRNNFQMSVLKAWDSVIFVQSLSSEQSEDWQSGQARIEFYVNNFKTGEKFFGIGNKNVRETDERFDIPEKRTFDKQFEQKKIERPSTNNKSQHTTKSLAELLEELDHFTGLVSIKESVKSFVSYLEFLKERKRLGLKAEEKIAINAVFLGNPGTGKTTVARMLGDIFYAMGILPNGHVVEVDRSALVGQFIGETAQKTEKLINDAIGGVLFIDEAYTLIKKGGSQDFGQEAIDILLKRMEDRKGEFVVIVAGYPEEMESFLNSNPGLRSRFSQTFVFDDYSPDEMILIFNQLLKKEDYAITEDAQELLKKEFISLFKSRDKSFGNARLVKRLFDESKRNLSKVCLMIPEEERTKELITTFNDEVIKATLSKRSTKTIIFPINEESLNEALKELEDLVGLNLVKKEIADMVKLARYFNEQGEDIRKVFSEHILFLGNPGTGKTTVARIFGKIYSALGILSKGHLVETDRQGLVAGYVGQTAEKTTSLIDKSLGGMLFIDEAYALLKPSDSGSDFGKEAIDILLKRMEDDRGKFVVVAAGYTDEMLNFVSGNPGIQSRFSKSFTFEDYSPTELMEIVNRTLIREKKNISKEAEEKLQKHFDELYKNRDKKFGNARIVRNILESVKQKMLLRLSDIPTEERSEEKVNTIELSDINEVLNRDVEAKHFDVQGDPLKLQEYIDELNQLIGLDNVKRDIYKLISFAKISQLKKERGLQSVDRNLHSVFIGNSGTGKKLVAKLMSKIFKELGILHKDHIVEVDRADLVAGYQGQTAVKTDKIIQQALDGTLIIKDAHNLFSDENNYGQEAIEMILKRMHDFKGRFFVILTSQSEKMKSVLKSNPGLSAYFPNVFNFDDYSPMQLLCIAADIAEKNGYALDEGALQELLDRFEQLVEKHEKNFDNGNLAKNILYSAITNQEERIFNIFEQDDVDLKTITLEDVQKIKI